MVLDTSAIMAILQSEPDAERFALAIEGDAVRLISSVTLLEARIVAEARRGTLGKVDVDALLSTAHAQVVPFLEEHVGAAHEAFRRYGKGRHPASLNFCDCVSYALAKIKNEALLYKGNDFAKTDIASALE